MIDKDADAVLDEVEAAIYLIAQSILDGRGFSYAIPSRAKGNQLYIPELDRIVLKDSASARPFASTATCRKAVITTRILGLVHELCVKRIHVTKRDLFYTDVKLFEVSFQTSDSYRPRSFLSCCFGDLVSCSSVILYLVQVTVI